MIRRHALRRPTHLRLTRDTLAAGALGCCLSGMGGGLLPGDNVNEKVEHVGLAKRRRDV